MFYNTLQSSHNLNTGTLGTLQCMQAHEDSERIAPLGDLLSLSIREATWKTIISPTDGTTHLNLGTRYVEECHNFFLSALQCLWVVYMISIFLRFNVWLWINFEMFKRWWDCIFENMSPLYLTVWLFNKHTSFPIASKPPKVRHHGYVWLSLIHSV